MELLDTTSGFIRQQKNPERYIAVFFNHLGGTRQEKTLQQMGDGKVEQLNLLGRKLYLLYAEYTFWGRPVNLKQILNK